MESIPMPLSHLRVAMWKNLRMRAHYPFIALLEFIVPIIIFHQGLNFHTVFETTIVKNTTVFPPKHQTVLYEPFKNASTTLVYTPKNSFTENIIKAITDALKPFEVIGLDDGMSIEEVFANQSFFHSRLSLNNWKAFGVSFKSKSRNEDFSYTIFTLRYLLHMKDTGKLFGDDFAVPTDKEDEYLTSGFLGFQFALDEAFIKMKSNSDSKFFNITIQKFPYPEYLVERFPENFIYHLTLTGFVFLALTVPYYIATERHSGMKEMMKMMGMNELIIWFGWITYSLMIYPIVITVVVVILKTDIASKSFYERIDAVLLWMIFILYSISNMTFLFSIGTLINKHWVAMVASVVICFITSSHWLTSLTNEYDGDEIRIVAIILLCLVPNLVLYNAFKALQYFELKGGYVGWSSLVTDILDPQILHLRTIILYFIINIFLNILIIVYVSGIRPGRYGHRKNLFFMVLWFAHFFRKKKEVEQLPEIDESNEYIEPTGDLPLGIKIRDLKKRFGYFSPCFALKGINLNIIRSHITVILGHNGAGKTTLLNTISGMLAQTSGDILYFKEGKTQDLDELNGKLGFCSQQIIYFNYLTVEEHILFCGMLRGMTEIKALREAHQLLTLFDMQEKSNNLIHELSGGMKKKLSLLMALIGRPEVLILDEPSSGLDVHSRRIIWDVLKKLKENRIIIITTQDMEEADMIGDRIAIMHDGQIFCSGSPIFLKTLFGTGYNMIITKARGYNSAATTEIIKSVIPSASVVKDTDYIAKYNLPLISTHVFSTLFELLESKLKELFITRIQMYCTTMDQVFINVSFLAGKDTERGVNTSFSSIEETPVELRTGPSLIFYQIVALFMKKLKLSYRRYVRFFSWIFLAVLLGIANIKIIDWTYLVWGNVFSPALDLSISTYPNAEVILFYKGKNAEDFIHSYIQVVSARKGHIAGSEPAVNVTGGLLEFSKYNLYEFRDNVVGSVEVTDNIHNVLYNELIPHSPPISLNTYNTALLQHLTNDDSLFINAVYQPILITQQETYCGNTNLTAYAFAGFWWIFIFNSAIIALFVYFISIIISERIHGIKHIQTMSNLTESTYWLGNFVYDYVCFVVLVSFTLIVMRLTDMYGVFSLFDMGVLMRILFLYGISALLYCYVFATICDSLSIFMLVNIILNICCLTTMVAMQIKGSSFFYLLKLISGLIPPFGLLNILARYLYVLINNNQCVYCMEWEISFCEGNRKIIDYYTANPLETRFDDTIKSFMHFLFVDIFIYGPLLLLLNSTMIAQKWNSLIIYIYGKDVIIDPNDLSDEDEFIKAEKEFVKKKFNSEKNDDHALLVYNLKKNLIINGLSKFTAVGQVNFFVKKGTCFGLVGVNGAGKSTTLKVLTAFMLPTEGDAKVFNWSLTKEMKQYRSVIGFCPQSNAIFEELTANEMLLLTATLRGLKNPDEHVKRWITTLDMEVYQDNLIETYSTGGKRKLCVALSFIGDPIVVFLDEPTPGIDPLARQILYKMIKSKKRSGQTIVVASHSLKECQTLCERVSILQNGVLKRIGSAASLKKKYAVGYTLLMKFSDGSTYYNEVDDVINKILNSFQEYKCILKDRRVGLLHFRILKEDIPWSKLFGTMENIKSKYKIIVEYTITNTTIEEDVFVSTVADF